MYGLPGLIMEAFTDDYDYAFQIKGIQKCKLPCAAYAKRDLAHFAAKCRHFKI